MWAASWQTPLEWAVTDHYFRSRAAASWPKSTGGRFKSTAWLAGSSQWGLMNALFRDSAAAVLCAGFPNLGDRPREPCTVKQPRTADLAYAIRGRETCMPKKKQNTARNRGSQVPNASGLPSEARPVRLVRQLGNRHLLSSPSLRLECRPCSGKGLMHTRSRSSPGLFPTSSRRRWPRRFECFLSLFDSLPLQIPCPRRQAAGLTV